MIHCSTFGAQSLEFGTCLPLDPFGMPILRGCTSSYKVSHLMAQRKISTSWYKQQQEPAWSRTNQNQAEDTRWFCSCRSCGDGSIYRQPGILHQPQQSRSATSQLQPTHVLPVPCETFGDEKTSWVWVCSAANCHKNTAIIRIKPPTQCLTLM